MPARKLDYIDLRDEQAERAVIGSILIDADSLLEVEDFLKPTHFYWESNSEIYRASLELRNSKKSIDLVTLSAQLKANGKLSEVGGSSYLAECVNEVPTSSRIKEYAQIVVDYARRRRVVEAYEKSKGDIYDLKKDTDQVITTIENAILEATQRPDVEKLLPDSDKLMDFLGEIQNRQEFNQKGKFIGLDTGFTHLNEVTLGLQMGLWIIGARPSLGKTTFIKQLLDQVAMNNPEALCLFVSYEQSTFELLLKSISRFSSINSRELQKGRLSEDGLHSINEAMDSYDKHAKRIYMLEGDGAKTNIDFIKSKARQLLKKHEAKKIFIAIDYLQLVPANGFFKSDKERIDAVCSSLRRLARDLDSPVVAVSSLNRANYARDKKGAADLDSFKESGGIEYSADLAMVMEEDKDATQTLTKRKNRPLRVINLRIIKNRNGERARITFHFDMPIATFSEIDKRDLEDSEAVFEE